MRTRNLTIVKKDGKYVVAQYGQRDGYPEGNGVILYNFAKDKNNIELLREKVCNCVYIDEVECDELETKFSNSDCSYEKFLLTYPQFSRDIGTDILHLIMQSSNEIKLINHIDFIADSLFCEWAYIIDLDSDTFEVFKGFNTKKLSKDDRFFEFETEDKYHPCKLAIAWKFDNLPETEEDFTKSIYEVTEVEESC